MLKFTQNDTPHSLTIKKTKSRNNKIQINTNRNSYNGVML